jgi:hypothetical protein
VPIEGTIGVAGSLASPSLTLLIPAAMAAPWFSRPLFRGEERVFSLMEIGASFKPPTVEVTSKHLTESRCRVVLLLPPFVTLLRLLSDGGSLSSVHESLLEKATLSLKRISIESKRRFDGPKLAFQSVAFFRVPFFDDLCAEELALFL